MSIPRRTMKEIKDRLKLEPQMREIYVEGCFDRDLYRFIINSLGIKNVKILPIATVDVPSELLQSQNYTSGERQRVEVAANFFQNYPDLHKQIAFIIDTDLDYIKQKASYKKPIINTDGASAEFLVWNKKNLEKACSNFFGVEDSIGYVDKISKIIIPIAVDIFLLRAAKDLLSKNWILLSYDVGIDKKTSDFSLSLYCQKVGDRNADRRATDNQLPVVIEDLRSKINTLGLDYTKIIHGHDLMDITIHHLHKSITKEFSMLKTKNSDELARLLLSTLEIDFIRNDPLILKIQETFNSN